MTIREQSYFALAALMDGPLHGYAIIKRAAELSDGRVRMAAGTRYAALDRLSAEGLLHVLDEEVVNGRPDRRGRRGAPRRGRADDPGGPGRDRAPPDGARPGGEAGMSHDALEARYHALMWAYPKRYRRDRGAEMIGTLMEAAGADQRRPVPVAVFLLPTDYETTIGVQPWGTAVVMAAFLIWVAVDARATVAAGLPLVPLVVATLFLWGHGVWDPTGSILGAWFRSLVVGIGALLITGGFMPRRQARA
ncbi:helix-turn-helix transcriptional regulator [Asanoa sp. NPDC049573]|uniref:PadR family transcriptional regulator n=1 Tax=Asanoa sp. NPDC049573 TaxID=3155396 RepID=UPI0034437EF0